MEDQCVDYTVTILFIHFQFVSFLRFLQTCYNVAHSRVNKKKRVAQLSAQDVLLSVHCKIKYAMSEKNKLTRNIYYDVVRAV